MSRARDSGISDDGDSSDRFANVKKTPRHQIHELYAAVRPLIGTAGTGDIEFVKTSKIIDFKKDEKIPYNARIQSDFDPESEEFIVENSVVCGIGSFEDLVANKKRFPKPVKRRSEVVHALANDELKQARATSNVVEQKKKKSTKGNEKSTKQQTVLSGSTLALPSFADVAARTASSNVLVSNALNFELEPPVSKSQIYELEANAEKIRILSEQLEMLKRQMESRDAPSTSSCTISTVAPKAVDRSRRFTDSLGLTESPRSKDADKNKLTTPSCTNSSAATLKIVHSSNSSAPSLGIIETPRSSHTPQSMKRAKNLPPRKLCINKSSGNATKGTSGKKSGYIRRTKNFSYEQVDYERDCQKYPELERRKNFEMFAYEKLDENTGRSRTTKRYHMCLGIIIPYRAWEHATAARSSSMFLRKLVLEIWDESVFVLLAVNIEKVSEPLERIPVRETPRRFMALRRAYELYLMRHHIIPTVGKTQKEKRLRQKKVNKFGRELGLIIDQFRRSYYRQQAMENEQAAEEEQLDAGDEGDFESFNVSDVEPLDGISDNRNSDEE